MDSFMAGGWEWALWLDGVYFSSLHGNSVFKKSYLEEIMPPMDQHKKGDPASLLEENRQNQA